MATILEFPLERAAARNKCDHEADAGGCAEIIIFPGVRIERWDEAEVCSAQAPQRRRRRKRASTIRRDRLELPD